MRGREMMEEGRERKSTADKTNQVHVSSQV